MDGKPNVTKMLSESMEKLESIEREKTLMMDKTIANVYLVFYNKGHSRSKMGIYGYCV